MHNILFSRYILYRKLESWDWPWSQWAKCL